MQTVIFCVLLIVFVISICLLFKVVSKSLMSSEKVIYSVYSVIPVRGKCNNIEYTVRSFLWNDNWSNYTQEKIILALDGCDDTTKQICAGLCSQYNQVVMCDINEISQEIKEN